MEDCEEINDYRENEQLSGLFIIVIGIIFLILLAIGIWLVIKTPPIEKQIPSTKKSELYNALLVPTQGSSSNGVVSIRNGNSYGDALSCKSGPTRFWNKGSGTPKHICNCYPPFWGENCMRESYSDKYLAVGTPNINDILLPNMNEQTVSRLSFPFKGNNSENEEQLICTELCDQDEQCTGVLWNGPNNQEMGINNPSGSCGLLYGDVIVQNGKNIPYLINDDATLYLKNSNKLIFEDRVFVWNGTLPLRYWLYNQIWEKNIRLLTMYANTIYKLTFIPTNFINDGMLIGVYSNSNLNISQIETIINNGSNNNYYIQLPGQPLKIPSSWKIINGIWGVYYDQTLLF